MAAGRRIVRHPAGREHATYLADVTTTRNGAGTTNTYVETVFDPMGRPTWTKGADGHTGYTAYDSLTGAVTRQIEDVDTDRTSDFAGLPSGWSNSSGQHLITDTLVDGIGRAVRVVDPNGSVTVAVYEDCDHETRTYRGVVYHANGTATLADDYVTLAGPIEIERDDWSRQYTENLTLNATPTIAGGVLTGNESIVDVQSLSRQLLNNAGQTVESDDYFSLPGTGYTATSAKLGVASNPSTGGHYLVTKDDYTGRAWLKREVTPDGTITRYVYDSRGHTTQVWKGVNDTPASGYWSPTNAAGMVLVQSAIYNNEGNEIESISWADATHSYATYYQYDFRDRVIGVVGPDGVGTRYTLDNEGNQTRVETFANTTVNSDGTLNFGTVVGGVNANLRGRVDDAYDDQGRVYRTTTYNVDPSTGVVGDSLTQNAWYDRRGDVVKVASANGLFQKTAYDGVGRVVSTYASYDDAESSWADAQTVAGDTVLSQRDVF